MSVLKTPYEISVWEDRLTLVDAEGKEYDKIVPEDVKIIGSYFKEIKLCIIGSDQMNSPIRAQEPELKRDVKGENTLIFSIYSKYYDEEQCEFMDNPFLPYLVNERKVKLKYYKKNQVKWLDFIIKSVEESSEDYKYTYVAKDLFINELAGNGFNLVFDQKLENNMGTVNELGAAILKDTDWEIGEDTEIIQQFQEEALYKITLDENIIATNIETNAVKVISKDEVIYGFYSSVTDRNNTFFQFIYNEDGIYLIDDNRVIYNADSYYINLQKPENDNSIWPIFAKSVEFVSEYRGERIVRYQETAFDKVLNKYVQVYSDNNGQKVYGYSESKYISEQIAQSYITNGTNFVSNSGWIQYNNIPLSIRTIPSFSLVPDFYSERYSVLEYDKANDNFLLNSGIKDNKGILGTISKNDVFCFRIKCGVLDEDEKTLIIPDNTKFSFQIKPYTIDDQGCIIFDNDKIIVDGKTTNSEKMDSKGYLFGTASVSLPVSEQELNENRYGIFISAISPQTSQTYYIQDVQLFKLYFDRNLNICLPDGTALNLVNMNIADSLAAYTQMLYYYYYPNSSLSKEEIEYIHIGDESPNFEPKYTSNFEKIRSITASETNRFDLLQTLAETFECWCRFDIKHKENGEIMLWKDFKQEVLINAGNSVEVMVDSQIYSGGTSFSQESKLLIGSKTHWDYQQVKFVTFHKYIGQENGVDFVYGVNLKSITRTLESDGIVSKLTVKDNTNEFAPYGSCSISRASENPSKQNSIYDFTYYINQGLLNYENLSNDLYSLDSKRGWLGYYTKLKNINFSYENYSNEQIAIISTYNNYNVQFQVIQSQYEANVKNLKDKQEEVYQLTQYPYNAIPSNSNWATDSTVNALCETILKLQLENKQLYSNKNQLQEKMKALDEQLKSIENHLTNLKSQKEKLVRTFEKKYYRFIQECPWTSDDYTDDNLYYLDSVSTLRNSCQPKVSYSINIIELSQLDGFENYVFELGDITHIQDTEFFGWVFNGNEKTPYREKIVVTEEKINFDNPEKNSIKVQNYRTQFEDLFQRLTVATQKIEFRSGAYNRAANIINPDGTIASEVLQDAYSINAEILRNSNNNSVTWDERGIITTNVTNPSEMVRITSGGIFLTNDGGQTWITGISGQGINAKTITTGQLNTENVTILNGNQASFRWDSLGINAYYKELQDDGKMYYSNKTFVRFDQYGIYGVKNISNNFAPSSESEVWDNASFALTWRGFMLKSGNNTGSIVIDSDEGIRLLNNQSDKLIHIGRLDEQGNYGIEVGGWKVDKHELSGSMQIPEGELEEAQGQITKYEVKLFSGDTNENYQVMYGGNSVTRNTWRLLVSNLFGVDRRGWVYADRIFGGQFWLDTTPLQRIKFTHAGIGLYERDKEEDEYDINPNNFISWKNLLPIYDSTS